VLGGGLAAAAALVCVALPFLPRSRGMIETVAQDYSKYSSGRLALDLRGADPKALERQFAASGLGFAPRVFDLSMMSYRLEGGRVLQLQEHPTALAAYRSSTGDKLLCLMYGGKVAVLPKATRVVEHGRIRFLVYEMNGVTEVFWQEGDEVCVLVSKMPIDDLVQLAFAKAMKKV
jgi:hypothetical protein